MQADGEKYLPLPYPPPALVGQGLEVRRVVVSWVSTASVLLESGIDAGICVR